MTGTEVGVTEPEATFSACFGAAFLVLHPTRYAEMIADKMNEHGSAAWLVNTGWSGGAYGTGKRMKLAYTRAIIDAIHSGELSAAETVKDRVFGFDVPTSCSACPSDVLIPKSTWSDKSRFEETVAKLAKLFQENFAKYAEKASDAIKNAGTSTG